MLGMADSSASFSSELPTMPLESDVTKRISRQRRRRDKQNALAQHVRGLTVFMLVAQTERSKTLLLSQLRVVVFFFFCSLVITLSAKPDQSTWQLFNTSPFCSYL